MADIRDIDALGDLKTAFGRFGEEVLQTLAALQKQFEEIQEQLEERQCFWKRQADEARDQLHEARHAMHKCHRKAERSDRYVDCSFEEEQCEDAKRYLAECEENLETVKRWRHRIEGQIADFQGDMHRLSNLASSHTSSVQAFLANKIEILDRYVSGSSAGVGISGLQSRGGNDNIFIRESFIKLTSDEKEALNDYSISGYGQINGTLRRGIFDDAVLQKAKLISQALKKFPPHRDTVYRRVPSGRYVTKYIVGNTVQEAGFTSASKLTNPKLGGDVFFTIKSKTGRDISDFAENKDEEEVLFDCGTKFKVLSRKMVNHITEIELEEL